MKNRNFAIVFLMLAASGCTTDGGGGASSNGEVSIEDMPAYCSRKAAAEFGVERRGIAMSPVDTSGGIYTLHGQYPSAGEGVRRFQCQFDPDRIFISVIPF
jgi:hypothetical protein